MAQVLARVAPGGELAPSLSPAAWRDPCGSNVTPKVTLKVDRRLRAEPKAKQKGPNSHPLSPPTPPQSCALDLHTNGLSATGSLAVPTGQERRPQALTSRFSR